MRHNRVGRTPVRLSAVGFGTCQLRLVPEGQAMETLREGFRLGVNWVHTAPDYGGAENLAARAVREAGGDAMMVSQGYGDMAHFEYLFENTCRLLDRKRLHMFGIACIDDREALGENVWGPGGMVDFLLEKKREGRLGAVFCSTHGTPEYISRLITRGCFDALMIAHNLLGFHLLSYFPKDKTAEDLPRNREILLPLARAHGVSLLIMKPLAGGLVSRSKAFPPLERFSREPRPVTAGEQLRALLSHPGVCSVVPGTASPEEARENALAGHAPGPGEDLPPGAVEAAVTAIREDLCRRCGRCEALCSRGLPISWLFRDAYIRHYPSETFETIDALQYFHLHPEKRPACANCAEQSCRCPFGIDIPRELVSLHDRMMRLRRKGLLPATPAEQAEARLPGGPGVVVLEKEVPVRMEGGERRACRIWIENTGEAVWPGPPRRPNEPCLGLSVEVGGRPMEWIPLRHEVPPRERTHFAFEFEAPWRKGRHPLRFSLTRRPGEAPFEEPVHLVSTELTVTRTDLRAAGRQLAGRLRLRRSTGKEEAE